MIDITTTMSDPALLGRWFQGASWEPWRIILRAAFGLPLSSEQIDLFKSVSGDREPPRKQVRELWIVGGRRSGKDSIASLIVAHLAAFFAGAHLLRPGERPLCMALGCDLLQSRIVLSYVRQYFREVEMLAELVERETQNGFQLSNGIDLWITRNDYRQARGRAVLCAVLDECAFYRDENSASPDTELYRAIAPSLATLPGSMLIGISSPYKRSGLLYAKWKQHFGNDSDGILVIQAPTVVLNSTIDRSIIERAYSEDASAAASEWGAEWRSDLEAFVSQEVLDSCVVPGRHELPPFDGTSPVAFFDASGGSGRDSFASAVAFFDHGTERVVLAAIRETRPPFSPEATVAEHAKLFQSYGIARATSDRWGGQFPAEQFRKHGIECDFSDRVKSDIYKEALPLLNSGRVELLDHAKLVTQLSGLERRTVRGGKDSIDHQVGSNDDVANAAMGACVNALEAARHTGRTINFTSIQMGPRFTGADEYEQMRRFMTQNNDPRHVF
jgi:hypothetical protein